MLLRHSTQAELAAVGEDSLIAEVQFFTEAIFVLVLDHALVDDVFVLRLGELLLHEVQLVVQDVLDARVSCQQLEKLSALGQVGSGHPWVSLQFFEGVPDELAAVFVVELHHWAEGVAEVGALEQYIHLVDQQHGLLAYPFNHHPLVPCGALSDSRHDALLGAVLRVVESLLANLVEGVVGNEVAHVELGEQALEVLGIPLAKVGGVAGDHNWRFIFFRYVDGECGQHDRLSLPSENLHQLRVLLLGSEEEQSCHLNWMWVDVDRLSLFIVELDVVEVFGLLLEGPHSEDDGEAPHTSGISILRDDELNSGLYGLVVVQFEQA